MRLNQRIAVEHNACPRLLVTSVQEAAAFGAARVCRLPSRHAGI